MKISTVLLAAGESWESAVLAAASATEVHVLKRCVDLTDLLATAASGQVRVAVVSAEIPRLDAEAVQRLRQHEVEVIAVGTEHAADRLGRLGVSRLVGPNPAGILAAISEVIEQSAELQPPTSQAQPELAPGFGGRTIVVWGPAGAPGRSTLALGIAAEVAAAGRRVTLIDADPYGGSLASQVGLLDESSGLLVAARRWNAGTLDRASLVAACRGVATNLDLLSGLPRADRRIEVRPGAMGALIEIAAEMSDVVVDTGFSIEKGERDQMTLEALAVADEIVVVGQADPIGLARLARGLVDLIEDSASGGTPIRVVLNRFRETHGWSWAEVLAFLGDYIGSAPVRVLPDDVATLDRSLSAGTTLVELGDSPVRVAIANVAEECFPDVFLSRVPRRRKAGRARRR